MPLSSRGRASIDNIVETILSVTLVNPDSPAVCADAAQWTYSELLEAARRVRARLEEHRPEWEPAVFVATRTCESLAVMLGSLLAGCPFAPIDPADPDPEARARRFGAQRLIADPRRYVANGDTVRLSASAATARAEPGDGTAAYQLLTSGTTARSKLVEVSQSNLSHYVAFLHERLQLDRPMHWAAVSSLATDLSYTAIFPALAAGGCVHIVDDNVRRDGRAFHRYLQAHDIEAVKMTPAHCRALLSTVPEWLHRPLRLLVLGGEPLPPGLAAALLDSGKAERIVNHYGPTETTIGVACHAVESSAAIDHEAPSLPIGRPLGEVELVVINGDGRPTRAGGTGELLIGGPTVANGYVGDPQLTRARFVLADPDGGGQRRFFRTDDRCKVLADGSLQFVGRGGTEVKVRGWRVEPSAVERAICTFDGVRDARVVMQGPASDARLDAVVVADNWSADQLRAALQSRLPAHMVPRCIEVVETLPLLGSGKFDSRRALNLIKKSEADDHESADGDPLTVEIAELMAAHLGGARPGPRDNFNSLGGDSLAAIHLLSRLQERGYDLNAEALLNDLTPRGVAAAIRSAQRSGQKRVEPVEQRTEGGLSPAQRWFFARDFVDPERWCQGIVLDAAAPIKVEALTAAVRWVVLRHPLLRTSFVRSADAPDGWRSRTVSVNDALSAHAFVWDASDTAVATATEQMLRGIDIGAGRLFVVARLRDAGVGDRLLLLAHHLVVDAVSWRILLDDLATAYCAALDGTLSDPVPEPGSFWSWVDTFEPDLSARPAIPAPQVEEAASTAVVTFGDAATSVLDRSALRAGRGLHEILLAAVVAEFGRTTSDQTVHIDVERHGRTGTAADIGRAVGWFTNTARLTIPVRDHNDFGELLEATGMALEAAASAPRVYAETAPICYNYLGRFVAPAGGGAGWSFSPLILGPLRGDNPRHHEITVNARIIEGRLSIDVVFNRRRRSVDEGLALARRVAERLVDFSAWQGSEPSEGPDIRPVPWSTVGQLALAPEPTPQRDPAAGGAAPRRCVLLTGATGFLGAYLLREFLRGHANHVICLVRPGRNESGRQRLTQRFDWYFNADIDAYGDRLLVIDGDVTQPNFGLPEQQYREFAREVDTVVHSAADVRLFTDDRSAEAVNVGGTRRVVDFAETGRPKVVHLMSTMSVAGQWCGPEPRAFTESDRNYGQVFRSAYEKSKLRAEEFLFEFVARGGVGWVHRLGSLTKPVGPGRSQVNLADNRVAQTIRLYATCGVAPLLSDEQLLLTPVDLTAKAVVRLASSLAPQDGTTHLVDDSAADHEELIAALRRLGHEVELVPVQEFLERTGDARDFDFVRWWLRRGSRRVVFHARRTAELLARMDARIEVDLRAGWLERVAADAIGVSGEEDYVWHKR